MRCDNKCFGAVLLESGAICGKKCPRPQGDWIPSKRTLERLRCHKECFAVLSLETGAICGVVITRISEESQRVGDGDDAECFSAETEKIRLGEHTEKRRASDPNSF